MNSKRGFFITVLLTAVLLCIAVFGVKIGN